jgi:hypothetical protein
MSPLIISDNYLLRSTLIPLLMVPTQLEIFPSKKISDPSNVSSIFVHRKF